MQTITKDELKKNIDSKEPVQVVNVLSPDYYHLGFIKGSKRIPVSELSERSKELDDSKKVVTYCASQDCHASLDAARILESKGFKVEAYEGGIKEWKEAGFPTE
jgi:rhodanese-related sulfurtransferase